MPSVTFGVTLVTKIVVTIGVTSFPFPFPYILLFPLGEGGGGQIG